MTDWTPKKIEKLRHLRAELHNSISQCAVRLLIPKKEVEAQARRMGIYYKAYNRYPTETIRLYECPDTPYEVLKQTYGKLIDIKDGTYYFRGEPRDFNDLMIMANKYRHDRGIEQLTKKESWRYVP